MCSRTRNYVFTCIRVFIFEIHTYVHNYSFIFVPYLVRMYAHKVFMHAAFTKSYRTCLTFTHFNSLNRNINHLSSQFNTLFVLEIRFFYQSHTVFNLILLLLSTFKIILRMHSFL